MGSLSDRAASLASIIPQGAKADQWRRSVCKPLVFQYHASRTQSPVRPSTNTVRPFMECDLIVFIMAMVAE
jgi:hypothetical protein